MSRRYCIPSKRDLRRRRRRRARSLRRSRRRGPTTVSTRPPAVTSCAVAHARCRRETPRRRASASASSMPAIGWPDSDDSGIAARREHDADEPVARQLDRASDCSAPGARRDEQRQQRLVDQRQDDLRFGIAEPHVELDHLRTVGGQHQADVQKAAKRMPFGRHPGDDRLDDLAHDARLERGVDERARRKRAHAAGVRARGRRRRCACDPAPMPIGTARAPSQTTKNDTSGPVRHSSMTSRSPAAPNRRSRHRRGDGRLGGRAILGDDDALAGGETVGFQHDRKSELAGPHDAERLVRPIRTCGSARSARRAAP